MTPFRAHTGAGSFSSLPSIPSSPWAASSADLTLNPGNHTPVVFFQTSIINIIMNII